MAKVRNRLLILFASVFLLAIGVFALSACNGSGDYTVTFYVQNEAGEWQQNGQPVEVGSDGTVELPNDPSKTFYTFRGWYDNTEFLGEKFTGEDVTKDMKVYACFVPDTAEAFINGESQGEKNLADIVNGTYEPGENLEFDGWYTDSNYGTKWDEKTDTDVLYARSVARITFNNGYEDVYTTTVEPGKGMSEPSSSDVVKNYMSAENIYYVVGDDYAIYDEKGNLTGYDEFDFSQPVTENMTITVLWKSPFLRYNQLSDRSLSVIGVANERDDPDENTISYTEVPVVSIPGLVTYKGETKRVVALAENSFVIPSVVIRELIIGEGIEYINFVSVAQGTACTLQSISLPSSLKVLDRAFNNLSGLTSVEIPEGVEVIIDSFWNNGKAHDFDIEIPDSVTNLAMVPSNFKFSDKSAFHNDGKMIYKDDTRGKLLIAFYDINENGRAEVPEGIVGIQVGTFCTSQKGGSGAPGQIMDDLTYLSLPSTWTYINYNALGSDYSFFNNSASFRTLWDEQFATNPVGNINADSYSITNVLGSVDKVSINRNSLADDIYEYAMVGQYQSSFVTYKNTAFDGKTVFVAESDSPEVSVTVTNWMTEESISFTFSKDKNSKISIAEIFEKSSLAELYKSGKITVKSVTELGSEYDFDSPVTRNLYMEIEWGYNVTGVTYEYDEETKTATVSGYDQNSAYYLSDKNVYLVNIPETTVKDGVTYTVTAIKANAFAGNEYIGYVFIPKTVKTIGDNAFKNCVNLIKVGIEKGGLEVIGKSAFEGTALTTIALPLSNLKEVGEYAFKIKTLTQFVAVEGEEDRVLYTADFSGNAVDFEGLKEGMFFFMYDGTQLVKYVKTTIEQQPVAQNSAETVDVKVYDVQLVAIAGGSDENYFKIGVSARKTRGLATTIYDAITRYEVMSGSCYYLTEYSRIYFIAVSKIHENAFTDIDMNLSSVKVYGNTTASAYYQYDAWLDIEDIKAIGSADYDFNAESAIFEDGWWQGIKSTDSNYAEQLEKFASAGSIASC